MVLEYDQVSLGGIGAGGGDGTGVNWALLLDEHAAARAGEIYNSPLFNMEIMDRKLE